MPIHSNVGGDKKEFKLAPTKPCQAVLFGVWDIGNHWNEYNGKKKLKPYIILGWELSTVNPDTGKRFTVFSRRTNYLVDKSQLKADLDAMEGRSLTKEECSKLDLESLIGKNCMFLVTHNVVGSKTYANGKPISPPMDGMVNLDPENAPQAPAFVQRWSDSRIVDDVKDLSGEAIPL